MIGTRILKIDSEIEILEVKVSTFNIEIICASDRCQL